MLYPSLSIEWCIHLIAFERFINVLVLIVANYPGFFRTVQIFDRLSCVCPGLLQSVEMSDFAQVAHCALSLSCMHSPSLKPCIANNVNSLLNNYTEWKLLYSTQCDVPLQLWVWPKYYIFFACTGEIVGVANRRCPGFWIPKTWQPWR